MEATVAMNRVGDSPVVAVAVAAMHGNKMTGSVCPIEAQKYVRKIATSWRFNLVAVVLVAAFRVGLVEG